MSRSLSDCGLQKYLLELSMDFWGAIFTHVDALRNKNEALILSS
jgi:hypothetical protein